MRNTLCLYQEERPQNRNLISLVNPVKDLGTPLNDIVYKDEASFVFMLWLVGFTDGEGTFSVEVNKKDDMTAGYQVQISYIITQHGRDLNLLEKIKSYFDNAGEIKLSRGKNGGNVYQYRLRHIEKIRKYIIPLFSNYQLQTLKRLDFEDFKLVAELIEKKEHLTQEGIEKIKQIKQGMNRGRI
jgi:DNA polymerase III delta prime subunit